MNINELTIGQAKELAGLFGDSSKPHFSNQFIGQEVILRTYSAGNHFGVLKEYDPATGTAILENSRRLHGWHVASTAGISLSEISQLGIEPSKSKICTKLPIALIAEVIEVLPTTSTAAESIKKAAVYRP